MGSPSLAFANAVNPALRVFHSIRTWKQKSLGISESLNISYHFGIELLDHLTPNPVSVFLL